MKNSLRWLLPLITAAVASASTLPCISGTLAAYEAQSACTVGDVTFSDFSFVGAGSVVLSPTAIQVQVVSDGSDQGLSFSGSNGAFSINAGSSLDALISYLITASALTGESLSMQSPAVTGNAAAIVVESICLGTVSANGACSGTTESLDVSASASAANTSDSVTFPAGTTTAEVSKNIILLGGSSSGSGASIASVSNTSPGGSGTIGGSPVPEPGTFSLALGAFLVATALTLRRKRARS
jgi:hypothetical protein